MIMSRLFVKINMFPSFREILTLKMADIQFLWLLVNTIKCSNSMIADSVHESCNFTKKTD